LIRFGTKFQNEDWEQFRMEAMWKIIADVQWHPSTHFLRHPSWILEKIVKQILRMSIFIGFVSLGKRAPGIDNFPIQTNQKLKW
jgi:hypothetical protein